MAPAIHTAKKTSRKQAPDYHIIESLTGWWVLRSIGDRAQCIERFDCRQDAERFIADLNYIAAAPRRVASH